MKRPIRSQGVSNQRTVQIHERRRIYQTDPSDPNDPRIFQARTFRTVPAVLLFKVVLCLAVLGALHRVIPAETGQALV